MCDSIESHPLNGAAPCEWRRSLEEIALALSACANAYKQPTSRRDPQPTRNGTQNASVATVPMKTNALYESSPSVASAEHWLALGTGALFLIVGASRRSLVGACLTASAAPLLYRGVIGRWPDVLNRHVHPDSSPAPTAHHHFAQA